MNANDFRFYSTPANQNTALATPGSFMPNFDVNIPGVNVPLSSLAMPTSSDLAGFSKMGAMSVADAAPKSATGFMGMLRGQPGVAGDGLTGWLGKGENMQTALGGIQALTGAYLGFQQLRLAKDNLRFQKDSWAKNYANQAQSYNTSLEDRVRARYSASSSDESRIQDYLNRNRLSKN